jgi:hypothetical protein
MPSKSNHKKEDHPKRASVAILISDEIDFKIKILQDNHNIKTFDL